MRLYRYRPVSEMLFKELLYGELYLASPTELNDPLDLNGQLNFFSETKSEISALVHFLCKRALVSHGQIDLWNKLLGLMSYERLGTYIETDFSNRGSGVVTKSDLFDILSRFYEESTSADPEIEKFKPEDLFSTLDKLFAQFLNNSCVSCFSESDNNFLMWSHYASGHTGICLEFEVDVEPEDSNICQFPLRSSVPVEGQYLEWSEQIQRVAYPQYLSKLKFFDLLPAFNNAGDVDLISLSKPYWQQYAHGMESIFLEKLSPWSEEKEWRIVNVEFQELLPEDRILSVDFKALTGVIFGAKSSERTQNRVRSALRGARCNPVYYKCDVDGTRGVDVRAIQR